MATVYLVHLDRKLNGTAQHYLGQTDDLGERMKRHRAGRGAAMLRAAKSRGIRFRVVRTWRGVSREFEHRLKARWHNKQLCPVCSGPNAHRRTIKR